MNRDLCRNIVACLRVAGPGEEHLDGLRNYSWRDWEAALDWMNLGGLALVFLDRVQKRGWEGAVPPPVRARLAASLAENRRRVAAMREEFDSLNRRFERAGIDCAVWKGFALIPEYCPDACLRPSYDYDYLVAEEGWEDAPIVLEAAGYVSKPNTATALHRTFAPRHFPAHLARSPLALYAAALPRQVELHRSPWDDAAFGISLKLPGRFLARKQRRTWQGQSFYCLEEPVALVFQALHAFQHILHNWCRLGWLREIASFLERRSREAIFWEKLLSRLEADATLREIVALVVSLAARLFHADLPVAIKDQIPRALRSPVALWGERYGVECALDNFGESKYSLLLYREFVREEAAWQAIRQRHLLPLHRPHRVAGTVAPAAATPLAENWQQAWYVFWRLVHHARRGVEYAWESARWDRLRRASAVRDLP